METLAASVETADAESREPRGLVPGDQLGAYTIRARIGRGLTGVVYRARDQTGGDVAIKLADVAGDADARLLALAHPNVVRVLALGEHDGRRYVAMEYVAGGTARTWRAERERSSREIVALYVAAASGLAAAHAAGITHRTFKPDNILVGGDGRARVTDFAVGSASGGTARRFAAVPAYAAPEQARGGAGDARSDQFAWCVALWEALHGVRPFDTKTREAFEASLHGAPRTGTRESAPASAMPHLAAVLGRGLARDPAERWPSLAALVAAIVRPRRRRRVLALGAVAVAIAVGVAAFPAARAEIDPCSHAAHAMTGSWNAVREIAIAQRFITAGAAWPAVVHELDGYATAWRVAERASCRAPASPIATARAACLDHARRQLAAVGDALGGGDRAAVASALDELRALPPLAACNAPPPVARPTTLADDVRLVALETAWQELDAEVIAHDLPGRATVEALLAATADLAALRPIAAAVHGRYALATGVPTQARADFETAVQAELELGDQASAAERMVDTADSYLDAGAIAAAQHWIGNAKRLAHELGDPPALVRRITALDARVIEQGPAPLDAAALRRREAMLDDGDPIDTHAVLAQAARDAGDMDAMLREARAGIDAAARELGAEHPAQLQFEPFVVAAALHAGTLDDAEQAARHAIALAVRWYGPDPAIAVPALVDLGRIRMLRGDRAGAIAATERALAAARARDPDASLVADLETTLGKDAEAAGDHAGALAHLDRATELVERLFGPDAEALGTLCSARVPLARRLGRTSEADHLRARAAAIAEARER